MSKALGRSFYLLIHTPVELARPICLGVFRKSPRNDGLFEQYMKNVEEARKTHGTQRYLMSKQEVQKWTPYFPTGLRAQIVYVTLTEDLA